MAEVEAALERFDARGDVLELACGTGLWTRHLARTATRVTAVDASPEVIELNRARVGDAPVEYVQADIFGLELPEPLRRVLLRLLALARAGRAVRRVLGERRAGASSRRARRSSSTAASTGATARTPHPRAPRRPRCGQLADGREFRIVKRYHEPPELEQRLAELGFEVAVSTTARGSMIYGVGSHG